MTNPVFPASITGLQDSKFYNIELEDQSIKTSIEGGYVVSRARHTRPPRRTYTTGFSSMTASQLGDLVAFWDSVRGGSTVFDWIEPITQAAASVRFVEKSLHLKYVGMGPTRLWDVTFKLEAA
jgi:hypothetical protein